MGSKRKGAAMDLAVIGQDPERERGTLKHIGGSPSDDWNQRIATETVQALCGPNPDAATRDRQLHAAINGLIGIAPQDEMEGMMAAQLLAAHGAAMECYRRVTANEAGYRRRDELGAANRLSRTFAVLLESLQRRRGHTQQKVTVQHVHTSSGGAAGLVAAPGAPDGNN